MRSLPSHHISEEVGGLDRFAEILTFTEGYYEALRADVASRHPDASASVLDHLSSLEAFLDNSILAGFSCGCDKAEALVQEGKLLGHRIGRRGGCAVGERVQATLDFAPLKEKAPVQQFPGCTNLTY